METAKLDFETLPSRKPLVRGLIAELFPGKLYPNLTADERRHYHSEWGRRTKAWRREKYFANHEVELSKKRAYAATRTEADRERKREWDRNNRHRTPAYYRRYRLKAEYGLTEADYKKMLDGQCGRCAICRGKRVGRPNEKKLHVDHNHTTGMVRSLLCHHCNMMLGHSKDSPKLLREAAAYLERHHG